MNVRGLIAAALFAVPAAFADDALPPASVSIPRQDVHHRGLFFRPDLGLGYLRMSASQGGSDASVYGFAGGLGLAIGGAIQPNHILAFHLWDAALANPTFSSNGSSATPGNSSASLVAFGPEYTFYSETNLYFSVSPALSRLRVESGGLGADSDWGFGLRLALGKEWWVSDNWGLGLAGQLSFSANKDSGNGNTPNGPVAVPTWYTWGATIAFSATYN
jgi:hypothetical protein